MKPNPIGDQQSVPSPGPIQFVRKSIAIYVTSAVVLPIICVVLGWRTVENIGKGFTYGSILIVLFGTFTWFGNTVPTQLSKLSLPKYSHPSTDPEKETKIDGAEPNVRGQELFVSSLIAGALLLITGLVMMVI